LHGLKDGVARDGGGIKDAVPDEFEYDADDVSPPEERRT